MKCVVNWTLNGINCANVFHVKYQGSPPTPTDANLIAEGVHSAWSQAFITKVSTGLLLESCVATDLSGPYASVGEYVQNITGGGSVQAAPNSVCVVGSWLISKKYRGGRPRTYISGILNADIQNGTHLLPASVTPWTNAFAGFRNQINAMSTPPVVGPFVLGCVHYQLHHNALIPPEFEGFGPPTVNPSLRSQRKRFQ